MYKCIKLIHDVKIDLIKVYMKKYVFLYVELFTHNKLLTSVFKISAPQIARSL